MHAYKASDESVDEVKPDAVSDPGTVDSSCDLGSGVLVSLELPTSSEDESSCLLQSLSL